MEGAPAQPAVVVLATDYCSCSRKLRGGRRGTGGWGKGRDEQRKLVSPSSAGVEGRVPGAPHPSTRHHLGLPVWGQERRGRSRGEKDRDIGTLGG